MTTTLIPGHAESFSHLAQTHQISPAVIDDLLEQTGRVLGLVERVEHDRDRPGVGVDPPVPAFGQLVEAASGVSDRI